MESTPLVGQPRIDALRRALKPDAFDRVVVIFQEAIADRTSSARTAVVERERDVALRLVHSIRGLCGNFGAARLAEISESIERMLATGDSWPPSDLMDELVDIARQTQVDLTEIQKQFRVSKRDTKG